MTAITFSESVDKLMAALISAQTEFPSIPKDGYNPHFKSKFSTLAAVKKATQPVLAKHQLAVTQFPSMTYDGKPALTTLLAHSSGQYIYDVTALSMVKQDPQAQGSAITYLRRYAWSAVLGLVTDEDDDDGNTATIAAPPKPAVDPAQAKAQREFSRLIAAAKRAGVSKEEAEKEFKENAGFDLAPRAAALQDLTDYADLLTERAVEREMSK